MWDKLAFMQWAKLNCSKSKEMVFTSRGMRGKSAAIPPPCLNICQVHSTTALGVVITDKLTAADHVSSLLTSCSSWLYRMRVLHDHGLPASSLQDVFHATVMAKLTYCASAWSGLCSANDHTRLDAFLPRCIVRSINWTIVQMWIKAPTLVQL